MIVGQAEAKAEEAEKATAEQRRKRREEEGAAAAAAAEAAAAEEKESPVADAATADAATMTEVPSGGTETRLNGEAVHHNEAADGTEAVEGQSAGNGEAVTNDGGDGHHAQHGPVADDRPSIETTDDGYHREHT